MRHTVKIDGVETVLVFDCFSGSRGYQYTEQNKVGPVRSHAFGCPLRQLFGSKFCVNGHTYEVVS